jgi:UrcA family protein
MKTLNTVRHTLLSAAAVAALAFPLFGSASVLDAPDANVQALDLSDARDQQALYERLQDQSRKVCGPTNLHVTGSVERSAGNEECYQETLNVAVQRVNNAGIQELHQQQTSADS